MVRQEFRHNAPLRLEMNSRIDEVICGYWETKLQGLRYRAHDAIKPPVCISACIWK